MSDKCIEPHKVTSPIQLLAAWFTALIALDGAFLTAARFVKTPEWLPILLVSAAIINVPLFIGCMFILQTRFRPEMQEDHYYLDYLKEKDKASALSEQLKESMVETGLNLPDLAKGRSIHDTSIDKQTHILKLLSELKNTLRNLNANKLCINEETNPDILLTLAQGLMADQDWLSAGKAFEEYAVYRPDDIEASYSRGVAFANSRGGYSSNLAALRAYNDAITFVTSELDINFRARLFTYRGAILKRLGRLGEAKSDLLTAQTLATNTYETTDIKYNLACVYALSNDRIKMLESINELKASYGSLSAIRAHMNDYFKDYRNDEEFLNAINL